MQIIRNWIFNLGKQWGIDVFLQRIGAWGTLAIAVLVGLLYLSIAGAILKLIGTIKSIGWRIIILLVALLIFAFLGYVYIDGCIAVIGKLGGLSFAKTV